MTVLPQARYICQQNLTQMNVHMIKKANVKYNTVSVLLMLLVNFKYTKSPTRWDDGYFSLTNPLPPAHAYIKYYTSPLI